MKITELIAALQLHLAKHGDGDVLVTDLGNETQPLPVQSTQTLGEGSEVTAFEITVDDPDGIAH